MIGHIVDTFVLALGLVPTAAGIRVTVIQTVPRTHTHTHTLIHINTHTHTHTHIFSYEKLPVRLLLDFPLVARNESWCYSCLCLSLFNNLLRGNKVGPAQVLRIDLALANGQYCFPSSSSMLAVNHVCVIRAFNSCLR